MATPYRSLQKALSNVSASGTIVIRAGVYHEGGTNPTSANGIQVFKSDITIQNYPGEAVWFDGSETYSDWTQSGAVWRTSWTKF